MKDNNQRASVALLLTLADTTWRMVVPTVLMVALGLFLDLKFGTKPGMTVLGWRAGFGLGRECAQHRAAGHNDVLFHHHQQLAWSPALRRPAQMAWRAAVPGAGGRPQLYAGAGHYYHGDGAAMGH